MVLIRTALLFVVVLFQSPVLASAQIGELFANSNTESALISDTNSTDGYFVSAIAFSDIKNPNKAREEARLSALKDITVFISGVEVSGFSEASTEYLTIHKNGVSEEFNQQLFSDLIQTKFVGNLNAAKVIEQGRRNGRHYVIVAVTEKDIENLSRLSLSKERASFSSEGNAHRTISSTGMSDNKAGKTDIARNSAIKDALRNAVQQANGAVIQGKSGRFGDAITMAISSNTQGYVSSYEITDESNKRGTYTVVLVAKVDEGKLVQDARAFLSAFGTPKFALVTSDETTRTWFKQNLENLGFTLESSLSGATHVFTVSFKQRKVLNHLEVEGIETEYTVSLVNQDTTESLLTIGNDVKKSRIFIEPIQRAEQVSKVAAMKSIKKDFDRQIIHSLAKAAERGSQYSIVLNNANRHDLKIFKHIFNNGTSGIVEDWSWDKTGRKLTLNFRYQGSLSQAMDSVLEDLYSTYKTEGKNRRPTSKSITSNSAVFDIRTKG